MSDQTFLEWPFFDASHRQIALSLNDWIAANRQQLRNHHGSTDESCRTLVRRLADGGWLRHAVPGAHGDDGVPRLDVRTLSLLRETLAYESGLADFCFAMQGLGSGAISLFGNPAQREEYLPAVASGQKIAAFALSEREAGSDVAALTTTARLAGEQWILEGSKTWISNGGIADFYTVFARTGADPGAKGLSAFVVDAATPGLRIAERIDVIAPHPLATLEFRDCRVPARAILGQPGQGFAIAMSTLDIFRTTVGAAALGLARRALDEALDQAKRRQLFGRPLADLQMTQSALAESALAVDAAALLVYRAAWAKDRGQERVTREAAMAKLFATEEAQRAIDRTVQLFGAEGVRVGSAPEALYREIRALRIYEGASEVQRLIIARQELARHTSGSP